MTTIFKLDSEADELGFELEPLLDVAVIGAGMAGLTAASKLNELGFIVSVFEKSRGTGGRLSSKRVAFSQYDSDDKSSFMAFDLGCASITSDSEEFSKQLQRWHLSGVIAPWYVDEHGKADYVGVPRNSALTRHLSKNLECHFGTRVTEVEQVGGIWHLFSLEEQGGGSNCRTLLARAKKVIIAAPPAQALDLLPASSSLKVNLNDVQVSAQWVMAVEVDNILSDLPAIQVLDDEIIFSINHESNKPGRTHKESGNRSIILQVQASPEWTSNHLDLTPDEVSKLLIQALEKHFEQPLNIVNHYAHRWLYSRISQGVVTKERFLWDEQGLGLVGDYINNDYNGIESAWLSGKQMAEWVANNLSAKLLSEQVR